MSNTIQLRVRRLVDKMWWHRRRFIHYRDADGNLYVRYFYWNANGPNTSYNHLDNDWNANNPASLLATLFIVIAENTPSALGGDESASASRVGGADSSTTKFARMPRLIPHLGLRGNSLP